MSDQPKKKAKVESRTLQKALKTDGGSNRELAERAGISFRAIAEARNGVDIDELKRLPRKKAGVVASMTRLAISLKEDPVDVLRELGIDPSDATVQKQIERAQEASWHRTLEEEEEDPVMRAIRAREVANAKSRTRLGPIVGIVPWKPFSDGDAGGVSVARLLTRSVLGSLNPAWDRDVHLKPEENFIEAERRLLSGDDDSPDCLIGLYDLPWRRRGDVDVIPLPGLYVAVGGFCTRPIGWREILASRDDALPHALVIKGDVGDRLLSGPVDYPNARLMTPLDTLEPSAIAKRIQREVETRFPSQEPHAERPLNHFLFVADGPLVCEVHDALDDSRLTMVGEARWAPIVRFGFAVRHDAKRFKELLEEAISEDLLGRAFPRTVHLYLKLLKSDRNGQIRLNLADFDHQGRDGAARFIEIALDFEPELESRLRSAVTDTDTKKFDELVENWKKRQPTKEIDERE